MTLDPEVCSRARLARDPRFDGKFFIGVLTTKIYCRPVCRTRFSKEENVRYFPTSAAAAEAGFRPCLRCHPECSPGSPVWTGTRNTVSRALQLIAQVGLENGGIESLAERVGVGTRHLRRLFLRHLGATPAAVIQSQRLNFAKKLIDETRLPMTQVALASGFGSLRRFNAAIRSVYHRTPTQIRRLARRVEIDPEQEYVFRLSFRRPYNWKSMLDFLAQHATPGVEAVESGRYRRSIAVNGQRGYFEIALDDADGALAARIRCEEPRSLFFVVERIRAMFDLNADWDVIAGTLRSDPQIAPRLDREAGLRVPGCWSGFEMAVRAILECRETPSVASGLAGRLATVLGVSFCPASGLTRLFPPPEALVGADLVSLGVPRNKAETLHALAREVCDCQISFERISDCDAFLARLSGLPGITNWMTQYVAMRVLRDPDAFPVDEVLLSGKLGGGASRELERRSKAWRPWRAYAAMLLWQTEGTWLGQGAARIFAVRRSRVSASDAGRDIRATGHD
jgi:AraC family transcriptional regulator, regulatory protein of adaptative response / DNA-3-methyladenine glycosylase II